MIMSSMKKFKESSAFKYIRKVHVTLVVLHLCWICYYFWAIVYFIDGIWIGWSITIPLKTKEPKLPPHALLEELPTVKKTHHRRPVAFVFLGILTSTTWMTAVQQYKIGRKTLTPWKFYTLEICKLTEWMFWLGMQLSLALQAGWKQDETPTWSDRCPGMPQNDWPDSRYPNVPYWFGELHVVALFWLAVLPPSLYAMYWDSISKRSDAKIPDDTDGAGS